MAKEVVANHFLIYDYYKALKQRKKYGFEHNKTEPVMELSIKN